VPNRYPECLFGTFHEVPHSAGEAPALTQIPFVQQGSFMESPRPQSSLVRVAGFIASVGTNNMFTKMDLLEAVSGVAQADRRMRDLREMGWIIENYKTNPQLRPEQYLVRKIGTRIDLGERRPSTVRKSITGPKRLRVLERDGHTCQICGITAAMNYVDEPDRQAVMTVGHIVSLTHGGTDDEDNLRTECTRCATASPGNDKNLPTHQLISLTQDTGNLEEKERLFSWMAVGRRTIDATEMAFNEWARLPASKRLETMTKLAQQIALEKQ
jgi:5-methylcytosine-specific restriction endonuclease McrA